MNDQLTTEAGRRLYELLDRMRPGANGDTLRMEAVRSAILDIEREAVARSSAEPALNVGRLAEAIWNAVSGRAWADHAPDECDVCDTHREIIAEDAAAIAAEYARLARSTEP